jgi:hypothetical protein
MTSYAAKKFHTVAVHEASHAVFCVLMDIPFVQAEIFPDLHPVPPGGATLGEITFDRAWPDWAIPENKLFDKRLAFNYGAQDICMTWPDPWLRHCTPGACPARSGLKWTMKSVLRMSERC